MRPAGPVATVRLLALGLADSGWVVLLTNDPAYWRPARKVDPIDAAFRLHEGRALSGSLAWGGAAGAGSIRGREAPLALAGTYHCQWHAYSTVVDSRGRVSELRYLTLPATSTPALNGWARGRLAVPGGSRTGSPPPAFTRSAAAPPDGCGSYRPHGPGFAASPPNGRYLPRRLDG